MNGAAIAAVSVNADGSDGSTLATATANSSGQFSILVLSQNGPVRFRASGGSYVSEQNGATISSPSPLSALLPNLQKDLPGLSINPLTTVPPSVNAFAATTPSMNAARDLAAATLLPNGKVLIAGGFNGMSSSSLSSTELYDPVTNTFAPLAATPVMNTARESTTATLLPNGNVLIVGGYDNDFLSSIELYTP
jgi:hypothetical protein